MKTFLVTLYKTFKGNRVDNTPYMNRVSIRGESREDVKQYLLKEGIQDILNQDRFELKGLSLEIGSIETMERHSVKREFERYALSQKYDISMDENGDYTSMETFDAFERFFANVLAKEELMKKIEADIIYGLVEVTEFDSDTKIIEVNSMKDLEFLDDPFEGRVGFEVSDSIAKDLNMIYGVS